MEQSKKYNFDFESGRPLKVEGGRWEWEVRAKLMPRGTTIPIIKEPLLGLIAVDNAIQRYSSSHSQGFRGVVFGYSPSTVLYKVEIKSQEFCQFHMKGDPKCFNLRYILHNSYAPFWKFL